MGRPGKTIQRVATGSDPEGKRAWICQDIPVEIFEPFQVPAPLPITVSDIQNFFRWVLAEVYAALQHRPIFDIITSKAPSIAADSGKSTAYSSSKVVFQPHFALCKVN